MYRPKKGLHVQHAEHAFQIHRANGHRRAALVLGETVLRVAVRKYGERFET